MSGVLSLSLSDIDRPDGWDDDLDTGRVGEIASDISERRQTITPIGVRDMGDGRYRLIYGRHRLKAHEQAGAREILCLLLEHDSPDEERAQVLAENLHRCTHAGPERRRLVAEYVTLKARLPKRAINRHGGGEIEDSVSEPRRGRPRDPEVAAKRDAAAAVGVSERTRQRAEQESRGDPSATPSPASPPKPITLKARVRNVVNELGDVLLVAQAFVDETSERAQRADDARDIYRDNPGAPSIVTMHQQLVSARGLLEEAHGYFEGAIREMERMESAVRAADGPPRPRTGLGGRKL